MDFSQLLQQGTAHAWLYIPVAILLGALHGLEPGHSKTMMAAFIIAVRGTAWQAALLGFCAALSHTLIIWILAGLALTMISVGVLASWGFQKLAEKSGWFSRVAHRAPYVSSYLLIALGMAFAFRGLAMMK